MQGQTQRTSSPSLRVQFCTRSLLKERFLPHKTLIIGVCFGRTWEAWGTGEEDSRPGRSKKMLSTFQLLSKMQVLTSEMVTSKWGDQHLFIRWTKSTSRWTAGTKILEMFSAQFHQCSDFVKLEGCGPSENAINVIKAPRHGGGPSAEASVEQVHSPVFHLPQGSQQTFTMWWLKQGAWPCSILFLPFPFYCPIKWSTQ